MASSIDKLKAVGKYLQLTGMAKFIAPLFSIVLCIMYVNELEKNAQLLKRIDYINNGTFIQDSIIRNNREVSIDDILNKSAKLDSIMNDLKSDQLDTISIDSALNILRSL